MASKIVKNDSDQLYRIITTGDYPKLLDNEADMNAFVSEVVKKRDLKKYLLEISSNYNDLQQFWAIPVSSIEVFQLKSSPTIIPYVEK